MDVSSGIYAIISLCTHVYVCMGVYVLLLLPFKSVTTFFGPR